MTTGTITMENAVRLENELSALLARWINDGVHPSQISIAMVTMGFVAGLMTGLRPEDLSVAVPEQMKHAQDLLNQAKAHMAGRT